MKEEYFHVRIIDTTDPRGGSHLALWQHVQYDDAGNSTVVSYVDDNKIAITLPKVYEARHISSDPYFAPGVQLDPDGYVPPPMADYLAALSSPEALDALIAKAVAAKQKAEGLVVEPAVDVTVTRVFTNDGSAKETKAEGA